MRKAAIYLVILGAVGIMIYYTINSGGGVEAIEQEVLDTREEREEYLRENAESPFVTSGQEMKELQYFPIRDKYRVSASIEKIRARQTVTLPTSDGLNRRYLKYAWLDFELLGEECRLLVLKPLFSPGLFLGFSDASSGEATYGGGRYLDIEALKGDRVTIDFNLAYNPYCAYVSDYSCPFPPNENVLPVAVEAGEKDYVK